MVKAMTLQKMHARTGDSTWQVHVSAMSFLVRLSSFHAPARPPRDTPL
jgi:hypothetical protein